MANVEFKNLCLPMLSTFIAIRMRTAQEVVPSRQMI